MSVNLSKIHSASFIPGLQNLGTTQNSASIFGSAPPASNLYGNIPLFFPSNNVMSCIRVNFPNAHGDLASSWFPLIGTGAYHDKVDNIRTYVWVTSMTSGRLINFVIHNLSNTNTFTASGYGLNAYAHMYTFPW